MPTVRRADPAALVLDLTHRLAEDFDSVPLPMVRHAVQAAAEAAQLFGNELLGSLKTIEQIARENLAAVRDTAADQAAELAAL